MYKQEWAFFLSNEGERIKRKATVLILNIFQKNNFKIVINLCNVIAELKRKLFALDQYKQSMSKKYSHDNNISIQVMCFLYIDEQRKNKNIIKVRIFYG